MTMISAPEVISQIVNNDEIALLAIDRGFFNASQYARTIRTRVEQSCHKPVRLNTITVALTRLVRQIEDQGAQQLLRPAIVLQDIAVKSGIVELTYNRNQLTTSQLSAITRQLQPSDKSFLAMSFGVGELTILCNQALAGEILQTLQFPPKVVINSLSAITLRFEEEYLQVANFIHSLIAQLAPLQVNIIEIVSTYTEITLVVSDEDRDQVVSVYSAFLGS